VAITLNDSSNGALTSAMPSGAQLPSVLHILAPGRYGGLESVVNLLAARQRKAGQTAAVAAVIDAPDASTQFIEGLRRRSVPTHVVRVQPRAYLSERAVIRGLCSELKPEIVHTHGYRADILSSGVARQLGIRTVTTVHGFTGGSRRLLLYEWAQRRSFRQFDSVVAVSRPLAQQIVRAGVDPARVSIISNVSSELTAPLSRTAARRRLGLPNDAFVVGSVGRVVRAKGFDLLIDALSRPDIPPETILAIVGDGPDREALEARAAAQGVRDRVYWCGRVDDAASLYAAFDVFALASRAEGSPISVLEAVNARVPVIASAVGGIPDMFDYGDAVLVPVGESEGIASAIQQMRIHPDQARLRADRARLRLAHDHSVDAWIESYASIYRHCLVR